MLAKDSSHGLVANRFPEPPGGEQGDFLAAIAGVFLFGFRNELNELRGGAFGAGLGALVAVEKGIFSGYQEAMKEEEGGGAERGGDFLKAAAGNGAGDGAENDAMAGIQFGAAAFAAKEGIFLAHEEELAHKALAGASEKEMNHDADQGSGKYHPWHSVGL